MRSGREGMGRDTTEWGRDWVGPRCQRLTARRRGDRPVPVLPTTSPNWICGKGAYRWWVLPATRATRKVLREVPRRPGEGGGEGVGGADRVSVPAFQDQQGLELGPWRSRDGKLIEKVFPRDTHL